MRVEQKQELWLIVLRIWSLNLSLDCFYCAKRKTDVSTASSLWYILPFITQVAIIQIFSFHSSLTHVLLPIHQHFLYSHFSLWLRLHGDHFKNTPLRLLDNLCMYHKSLEKSYCLLFLCLHLNSYIKLYYFRIK